MDKGTGYIKDTKLTEQSTMFFQLLFKLYSRNLKRKRGCEAWMSLLIDVIVEKYGEKVDEHNNLFV